MLRPLLVVGLMLLAFGGSADAAKKRSDPVAPVAASARAAFASGLKTAESAFVGAVNGFTKDVKKGVGTSRQSATEFGDALAFYATSLKRLADVAAASIGDGASQAMSDAGDPTIEGGVAGDGGSLDTLTEYVQTSLEDARRRALARARKFAATLAASSDSDRLQMTVVLPTWSIDRRVAPTPDAGGVLPAGDEPIRVWVALATRLDGADAGTVLVTMAGGAPQSADKNFHVQLRARTELRAVGPLLSEGGMTVVSGTWSVTEALNDPHLGEAVSKGNRLIEFGVDPYDAGLAGRQPGAYQHAGAIGIQ